MAQAAQQPCPRCGDAVTSRQDNPAWPFCGERCKWIDLGAWIEGDYRIPAGPDGSAQGDGEVAPVGPPQGRFGGGVAEG